MKKYSVSLHGHPTSISLEPVFWDVLGQIARQNRQSVASLIRQIDDSRISNAGAGLSGAIRLFVLRTVIAASQDGNGYFVIKDDE